MSNTANKGASEKKVGVKFAIRMIVALVVGYIGGFGAVKLGGMELDTVTIYTYALYICAAIFVAYNIICPIFAYAVYRKNKRQFEGWNGEDEEELDKVDNALNVALLVCTVSQIVSFAFFPIIMWLGSSIGKVSRLEAAIAGIDLLVFIWTLVWCLGIQHSVVKLVKAMNPEKQGSVFEKNFTKTWLESCDEAERLTIYKCSYKAYKATNTVCMVMWLLSILTMEAFDTGIFPIICTCVIMLTSTLIYTLEAMKTK